MYLDESSIDGCRYMGVGGLWIPDSCESALRSSITAVRAAHGMNAGGEFKWTKNSGSKGHPAYRPLVDAFFANKDCRFNAMIVDRRDPGRNRGDDRELDHYKSVFWLVRKRVEERTAYRLVLDHRTNRRSDRLTTLLDVLNNSIKRDRAVHFNCMREVIVSDSRKEPLVQLADVLLGAVCFHFNRQHEKNNASRSKCDLATYIAKQARWVDGVIGESYPSEPKFNVWLWRG